MIKIVSVLAEINQEIVGDQVHYFSVSYIKADGSPGHKEKARKNGTTKESGLTPGLRYNVKEKGVLLLWDELEKRHFAIKISRITHYKGREVWH